MGNYIRMKLIRNTITICLILIFSSVNGQESKYLIIDQHSQKLKFHNLCVYKSNDLVESLMSDKHGQILLDNKYLSPDYKLEIMQDFCYSDTIIYKDNDSNNDRLMIATFNDSCLTLQKKVSKIESYAYKISKRNKGIIKTRQHDLDSIDVQIEYFRNKIRTDNHFKISSSELEIDFFFKKDNIVCCYIKELNPNIPELYKATRFYYENGILIHEDYFTTIQTGIIGDLDKDYNIYLTPDFLKRYTQKLIKITTHNSKS